ncbi:hypothetical protein TNCV_1804521 [Trichonephila clavipes]|nr:hypothetical protein TNCV_1804521 [Trichonephila clavipes]
MNLTCVESRVRVLMALKIYHMEELMCVKSVEAEVLTLTWNGTSESYCQHRCRLHYLTKIQNYVVHVSSLQVAS